MALARVRAVPLSAVSVRWPRATLPLSKQSASSYPGESVILGREWLRSGKGSSSVPLKEEATASLCGDTVKYSKDDEPMHRTTSSKLTDC